MLRVQIAMCLETDISYLFFVVVDIKCAWYCLRLDWDTRFDAGGVFIITSFNICFIPLLRSSKDLARAAASSSLKTNSLSDSSYESNSLSFVHWLPCSRTGSVAQWSACYIDSASFPVTIILVNNSDSISQCGNWL